MTLCHRHRFYDGDVARGHPVDADGLVSPDPAWPADRAAPGELDFIRRFCNTVNLESGADRLATVASTTHWLADEGVVASSVTRTSVDDLHGLRTSLHTHLAAHNPSLTTPGGDAGEIAEQLAALRFGVSVDDDGVLRLRVDGRDAYSVVAGRVVSLMIEAQHHDRWRRIKACRHCRWVFYDSSKNRSGTWCSMRACGGRAKVNAYRARNTTR